MNFIHPSNPRHISSRRALSKNRAFRVHANRGFTLIELLTVVAIICILAAILMVSLGRIREAAHRSTCLANLRQIQGANMLYAADHKGAYVVHKKNGKWWMVQDSFTNYLNAWKQNSDGNQSMADQLKCFSVPEVTLSNWEQENFGGYGYNSHGCDFGTVLHQNAILTPARTMAFIDALDFHVHAGNSGKYTGKEAKTDTTTSYRHGNGANVVFWDGHAKWLPRKRVDHKMTGKTPEEKEATAQIWRMLAP